MSYLLCPKETQFTTTTNSDGGIVLTVDKLPSWTRTSREQEHKPERKYELVNLGKRYGSAVFGVPVSEFTDYDFKFADELYIMFVDPQTGKSKPLKDKNSEEFT